MGWFSSSTATANCNSKASSSCPIDHKNAIKDDNASCPIDHLKADNLMYSAELLESREGEEIGLPAGRVVSSIPRADSHENWKYPSQQMFYNAMKRKGHDPKARDMETVVMMHNVVNEQTWQELSKWEREFHCDCEDIKLKRFRGKPDKSSPKATIKSWLGYEKPFDRHDWTIDRCGKEVNYVIDFYPGKAAPEEKSPVSIFLDVRPALDSWENLMDRIKRTFQTGRLC